MAIPSYDQVVLDSVPTAYWKLDELNAAVTAVNSSINGSSYDGTYTVSAGGIINKEQVGPLLYSPTINKSVQFVSSTDTQVANVTLPLFGSLATPTLNFTLECWLRIIPSQSGHAGIPFFIHFPPSSILLSLNAPGVSSPYFIGSIVNNASGQAQVISLTPILLADSWNYVVLDFQGQIMNLYMNNILVGTDSTPAPGAPTVSSGNPVISQRITVTMSRVAWYTRVLTQTERELHYAASCR